MWVVIPVAGWVKIKKLLPLDIGSRLVSQGSEASDIKLRKEVLAELINTLVHILLRLKNVHLPSASAAIAKWETTSEREIIKKKNVGSAWLLDLVVGQWLVFGQWAAAGKRSSAAMNAAIQGNVWLTFSIVYVQHCTGRAGGGDTAQGRRKQRQA